MLTSQCYLHGWGGVGYTAPTEKGNGMLHRRTIIGDRTNWWVLLIGTLLCGGMVLQACGDDDLVVSGQLPDITVTDTDATDDDDT